MEASMIIAVEEVRGICTPPSKYQLVASHNKSRCFKKVSTAVYPQEMMLSNSLLLRENKGQMLNDARVKGRKREVFSLIVSHTATFYDTWRAS